MALLGNSEIRILIAPADALTNGDGRGNFLSLKHPKSGNKACYLYADGGLLELNWFKQSYGSWFLGDHVCEDGRLYTATPVDPVFILLPLFEEARMQKEGDPGKFRQLDEIIYIPGYPGYQQLLSTADESMQIVCDFKEIGGTKFFRLNDTKVLRWLVYKVHQLRQVLPTLDKNYAAQSEKATLTDAVLIMSEYLKEEPWLKLLCTKLKLSLEDEVRAPVSDILPSAESGVASFSTTQEKNLTEKKTTKAGKQTKKAKVEKDSQNIKDMFSRASRKRS